MKAILTILSAALALAAWADGGTCLVTNCAEVSRILRDGTNVYARFELTVRALSDEDEYGRGTIVADGSGATILSPNGALNGLPPLRNGDCIAVSGRICKPPESRRFTRAESVTGKGRSKPYVPPTITPDEFVSRRDDFRPVRLCGTVRNMLFDEIDPAFAFLVLEGSNTVAYVACRYPDGNRQSAQDLIGAQVAVTGIREMSRPTNRRQIGSRLMTRHGQIEILRPPPAEPFAVPAVDELTELGPTEVARSGPHRAQGTVLAVWDVTRFLLRQTNGELSQIRLAEGPAPRPGTSVEVVGSPASDPYHINLVRARWRASALPPAAEPPAEHVRSSDIFRLSQGGRVFVPRYHGKTLRVTGTLVERNAGRLYLQDGTGLVTVDARACGDTGWPIGSTISATGVCVMDIDIWQPHETFPQIKGFTLVTRRPGDLRLVALAPWWTPARIWTVVGILACVVIGILAWNVSLRILAERRGRALLREQIEQVKARLKVEERTRLAVELHDSLSQTLTGVSMEIAAAETCGGDASDEMSTHLARAGRTLKSCRDELRNCLWDLRSDALDFPDMTQAVLKTLQPHVDDDSQLSVRFNVPRARVSDNTAHALLRMIRELVVNAIKHGNATSVKIAGSLDPHQLNFSVRDNGCGFDPDDRPGILQGHFGLQGVRERLERLGGSLTIESAPGRGAHITGRIPTHTPTVVGV